MNIDSEKTVNTKPTQMPFGPTAEEMRLSRLSHPRATLMAIILLAAVFVLFGMFASAGASGYTPTLGSSGGTASLIGTWVQQHVGLL